MRTLRVVLAFLLYAVPMSAQDTPIPPGDGGRPTLDLFQQAVDEAPDGAVIRTDDYLPRVKRSLVVRTDRSLTFVGGVFQGDSTGPAIFFETETCYPPTGGCWNSDQRTIRLIGVAIVPAKVKAFTLFDIHAGGLGRLILEDCWIRSAHNSIYMSHDSLLAIRRSVIQAGDEGVIDCYNYLGASAVVCGSVGIFDSWIEGGDGPRIEGPSPYSCLQPCTGRGGIGVIANTLGFRNTTLRGGRGAWWVDAGCMGPTGEAYTAGTVVR